MFQVTCMSNPGTLFKLKKIKLWNVVIIYLKTKHYFSFRWKNKKFFVDGWKSALVNQTRVTINDVDCPCKSSINQCVYPSGLRSVEFQMVNWAVSTLWLIQRLAHDKLFYLRQKLNTKEGSGGGLLQVHHDRNGIHESNTRKESEKFIIFLFLFFLNWRRKRHNAWELFVPLFSSNLKMFYLVYFTPIHYILMNKIF